MLKCKYFGLCKYILLLLLLILETNGMMNRVRKILPGASSSQRRQGPSLYDHHEQQTASEITPANFIPTKDSIAEQTVMGGRIRKVHIQNQYGPTFYHLKCIPESPQARKELATLTLLHQSGECPWVAKIVCLDEFGKPSYPPETVGDVWYYGAVMEYVEGVKMSTILQPGYVLTENLARVFLWQIAKALSHLHDSYIVFGRLEADNITLLTKWKNERSAKINGKLKLTDFEFAGKHIQGRVLGKLGDLYDRLFTIHKGHSSHDTSYVCTYEFDWWAFGVLMYRMLVGKDPFLITEINGGFTPRDAEEDFDYFRKKKLELKFEDEFKITGEAKDLLQNLLKPEKLLAIGPIPKELYDFVTGHVWFQSYLAVEDLISNEGSDELRDYTDRELKEGKKKNASMLKSVLHESRRKHFFETSLLTITPDDFQKGNMIGEGGFGKVFRVKLKGLRQETRNRKLYAMKEITADREESENEINIIELLRNLKTNEHYECPYIIGIKCFDPVKYQPNLSPNPGQPSLQPDTHYRVVMDYMGGGDLSKLLQETTHLTEDLACLFLVQIAQAIEYLHGHHIIYRDLKPANIMLEAHENGSGLLTGRLKIIDFGLSTTQEYPEVIKGTHLYFSPEIAMGQKYSKEIDWWAFGVLMYQMLVGQPPFSGETIHDTGGTLDAILKQYSSPQFGPIMNDDKMSEDARNLISQLLEPFEDIRLKSYEDIMEYHWFSSKRHVFEMLANRDDMTQFVKEEIDKTRKEPELTRSVGMRRQDGLEGGMSGFGYEEMAETPRRPTLRHSNPVREQDRLEQLEFDMSRLEMNELRTADTQRPRRRRPRQRPGKAMQKEAGEGSAHHDH